MILSMNYQTFLFFSAVAFGFFAGFLYDFFKIFRKIVRHKKIFVQIEDFFYWTACSLVLFFIMLEENFGEVRGFLILGAFVGMILYFVLLSRFFISVSNKILFCVKKFFMFLFGMFFIPLRSVFFFFKKIFLFFWKRIAIVFKHRQK